MSGAVPRLTAVFLAARRSFKQSLRHDSGYLPARTALEFLDAEIGKRL